MESKLVSIIILTFNSEKYIENCLKSIFEQTYKNVEVLIIDNNSKDKTIEKTKGILGESKGNQRVELIENSINLGYTGGNNIGIKQSRGEYVILLNPDVILDRDFVKEMVNELEKNPKISSVQAKIYQLNNGQKTDIIDTIGFKVFKSGEINDKGQGEKDTGQYDKFEELFAVNGVAPAYRRTALDDVRLKEEYLDEDFFCYAEDIDLGWRLRWRNWSAVFNPRAIAWHDRTSSKKLGKGFSDFRETRKKQSFWVRQIGWRNQWFLFIKNLSLINFIIFFPRFFLRQAKLFFYLLIFETKVLGCIIDIIKLTPKMLKKRRIIMKQKKISNKDIRKWFK